jgi:hypothetical protein
MIDRRPEVLEIAARTTRATALGLVPSARISCYFGQLHGAPELIESCDSLIELCSIALFRTAIVHVDREHVSHGNVI